MVDQKLYDFYIAQFDCQGKCAFIPGFFLVSPYIDTMLEKESGNFNMAIVDVMEHRPVVPRLRFKDENWHNG